MYGKTWRGKPVFRADRKETFRAPPRKRRRDRERVRKGVKMAEETQGRTYEPPEDFARVANVDDASIYEEAERDYEGFWADRARELHWFKEWDQVLDWDPPEAQW